MNVLTRVATALAWPLNRVRRRETPEEDAETDQGTMDADQAMPGAEGGETGQGLAPRPARGEQAPAASVLVAVGGAAPAQGTADPGQATVPTPAPEAPAAPAPEGERPKDDLLKLFSEDLAGNEDMERLAPFLKDVDVYDLAEECQAVAVALQKRG